MSASNFRKLVAKRDAGSQVSYTGTIVTRCRTTGHTDAFSMSGFSSFAAVVDHLKSRARNPNCELREFVAVCVVDCKQVQVMQYTASEVAELVEG